MILFVVYFVFYKHRL